MKYYAKQIPPEQQMSPIEDSDSMPQNIILTGNPNYNGVFNSAYTKLVRGLERVTFCLEDEAAWNHATLTGLVESFLPSENKEHYSTNEIHKWKEIIENSIRCQHLEQSTCDALGLMTGYEWSWTQISGCTQGEWEGMYYPTDCWTATDIQEFETEFFNTGTEWIIHDSDDEPETADDVDGYSIYCHSDSVESIKAELAKEIGTEPENVVLFQCGELYSFYKYNVV